MGQRAHARSCLIKISEQIPDKIGRYEVISLLGKGGYARVYKARLRGPMGFTKTLAIKVTAAPEAEDSKQVKALVNEARICGLLQHPNIIEVYEFGRWGPQYFIAMEYIDGLPLDGLLKAVKRSGRLLTAGFAIETLSQVCRGLKYAHRLIDEDGMEHQVIHRDIKPGNLMMTSNNLVKIMDFGIAKSALSLTQTMEGFTKGTPMYMSPEQVQGAHLTPASDIYSLGIILYEIMTGERLFAAHNLMEIIEKVALSDIKPDLERHRYEIGNLMPILAKMLNHEPGRRYTSAQELLSVLEDARTEFPAGRSIAAVVEDYRDDRFANAAVQSSPPTAPTTPSQAISSSDGKGALDSWSVVMPAISQEITARGDALTSLPEAISVSLELIAHDPERDD